MVSKLFTSRDDAQLPSLDIISDNSTSIVDSSSPAREDYLSSSDEEGRRFRLHYCSESDDDDDGKDVRQAIQFNSRRRLDRCSHHRGEAADDAIDLSTRSDGRGGIGRSSRRSPSPSRTAKGRRSRSSQARFAYSSRRSSLGGTTVYRTAFMASLDAYLNTTSGLRLRTDGKCTFQFEKRRFIIKCASPEEGGDGDFTFYLSLGPMKELQDKVRSKNLLKSTALWNEELKQRCQRRQRRRRRGAVVAGIYQDDNDDEKVPSSGLIQIDPIKSAGDANVAFVYYGHVEDIKNAPHFQAMLDDYVDDAIYLFDRINNYYTNSERGEDDEVKNQSNNRHRQRLARSLPSLHTEEHDHDRSKSRRGNNTARSQSTSMCKLATFADPPCVTASSNTSSTDISADNNVTSVENSSKSIFSRVISSLRSKSSEISFTPFVGLGNQEQDCYVVDERAVKEGTVKPTIVLSRMCETGAAAMAAGREVIVRSEDVNGTEERQLTVRKNTTFCGGTNDLHRRSDCSRPRREDQYSNALAGSRCQRPRERRSITFDTDVKDRGSSCYEVTPSRPRRKTFGAHDNSDRHQSTNKPHRKSTVFVADDYTSYRPQSVQCRRRS